MLDYVGGGQVGVYRGWSPVDVVTSWAGGGLSVAGNCSLVLPWAHIVVRWYDRGLYYWEITRRATRVVLVVDIGGVCGPARRGSYPNDVSHSHISRQKATLR